MERPSRAGKSRHPSGPGRPFDRSNTYSESSRQADTSSIRDFASRGRSGTDGPGPGPRRQIGETRQPTIGDAAVNTFQNLLSNADKGKGLDTRDFIPAEGPSGSSYPTGPHERTAAVYELEAPPAVYELEALSADIGALTLRDTSAPTRQESGFSDLPIVYTSSVGNNEQASRYAEEIKSPITPSESGKNEIEISAFCDTIDRRLSDIENYKKHSAEPPTGIEDPRLHIERNLLLLQARRDLNQAYAFLEQKKSPIRRFTDQNKRINQTLQRKDGRSKIKFKEENIKILQKELLHSLSYLKSLGEYIQQNRPGLTKETRPLPTFHNYELLDKAITQLDTAKDYYPQDTQFGKLLQEVKDLHGDNGQYIRNIRTGIANEFPDSQPGNLTIEHANSLLSVFPQDLQETHDVNLGNLSSAMDQMRVIMEPYILRREEIQWLRTHCSEMPPYSLNQVLSDINDTGLQLQHIESQMLERTQPHIAEWTDKLRTELAAGGPEPIRDLSLLSNNIDRFLATDSLDGFPYYKGKASLSWMAEYLIRRDRAVTFIMDQNRDIDDQTRTRLISQHQEQKDMVDSLQMKFETGAQKLAELYNTQVEREITTGITQSLERHRKISMPSIEDLHVFYRNIQEISARLQDFIQASQWLYTYHPPTGAVLSEISGTQNRLEQKRADILKSVSEVIRERYRLAKIQESSLDRQPKVNAGFAHRLHTRQSIIERYNSLSKILDIFGSEQAMMYTFTNLELTSDNIQESLSQHQNIFKYEVTSVAHTSITRIDSLLEKLPDHAKDLLEQTKNADRTPIQSVDQGNHSYTDIYILPDQNIRTLVDLVRRPADFIDSLNRYSQQRLQFENQTTTMLDEPDHAHNLNQPGQQGRQTLKDQLSTMSGEADQLRLLIPSDSNDTQISASYDEIMDRRDRLIEYGEDISTAEKKFTQIRETFGASINELYERARTNENWLNTRPADSSEQLNRRQVLVRTYTLLSDVFTKFGPAIQDSGLSIPPAQIIARLAQNQTQFNRAANRRLQISINEIDVLARNSRKASELLQKLEADESKKEEYRNEFNTIWREAFEAQTPLDHDAMIKKAERIQSFISRYKNEAIRDNCDLHATQIADAKTLGSTIDQFYRFFSPPPQAGY